MPHSLRHPLAEEQSRHNVSNTSVKPDFPYCPTYSSYNLQADKYQL